MKLSLQALVGVELPIIQAPMAGVQDHALAVAVANAGGLGSLPCATFAPDDMKRELEALTTKTSRPFHVNFFAHTVPVPDEAREMAWKQKLGRYYEELGIDPASVPSGAGRLPFSHEAADVLESYRPPIVSFHFGLPAPELLERVRAMGSKVFSTATTLEEALWLESRGVDAIILQGSEAGGHRGMFLTHEIATQVPAMELLQRAVAAVSVPLIAAGGIADGSDVQRVMDAGASGVQVGTAYLLSAEATTSAVHRAVLSGADARHTEITNIFTGRPARGIVNRVMREMGAMRDDVPEFPRATAALAPLKAAAERSGRGDFSNLWAGEKASQCRALPAAEITRALAGI